MKSNPVSKLYQQEDSYNYGYSLPCPLIAQQVNIEKLKQGNQLQNQRENQVVIGDPEYIPERIDSNSSTISRNQNSSSQHHTSQRSYDPLSDLSGYLRMRDQL